MDQELQFCNLCRFGGLPPLFVFLIAAILRKYSDPRFAVIWPPFRPRFIAAVPTALDNASVRLRASWIKSCNSAIFVASSACLHFLFFSSLQSYENTLTHVLQ